MLVDERQREIVQLLQRDGSVHVQKLAKHFRVTTETIRRDLDKLEEAGRLQRSHGGAVSVEEEAREVPHAERESREPEEKRAIGAYAAGLVEEGDTIFIDASSTALALAQALPDRDWTVLTNAYRVVWELSTRRQMRVIHVGGRVVLESFSCVGPAAEKMLDDFRVDKAFFSCRGIDLDFGLSEASELQATLKQRVLRIAARRILMADHTKFGLRGLVRFGQPSEVTDLVTGPGAPEDFLRQLARQGVRVARVA